MIDEDYVRQQESGSNGDQGNVAENGLFALHQTVNRTFSVASNDRLGLLTFTSMPKPKIMTYNI
ncbi:hypothetical protein [Paenibacillus sp. FSL W8-0194]|uniref:hypothetical protein n=1 Tax=Paenibacillus sp. FSL W8-0194 TaxID=2921711 RepID=UPI0030DAB7CC